MHKYDSLEALRYCRKAFLAKCYKSAIRHLKYSVRKKKKEDSFYFLMGLSYLKKGDKLAAHRWLEKAERVAEDEDLTFDRESVRMAARICALY